MSEPLTIYECPECGRVDHRPLLLHDAERYGSGRECPGKAQPVRMFRQEDLVWSSRIYRVIADPLLDDGADPWLVGSTFEADIDRAFTERIIEALIEDGSVELRGGRLYPAAYEDVPRMFREEDVRPLWEALEYVERVHGASVLRVQHSAAFHSFRAPEDWR